MGKDGQGGEGPNLPSALPSFGSSSPKGPECWLVYSSKLSPTRRLSFSSSLVVPRDAAPRDHFLESSADSALEFIVTPVDDFRCFVPLPRRPPTVHDFRPSCLQVKAGMAATRGFPTIASTILQSMPARIPEIYNAIALAHVSL